MIDFKYSDSAAMSPLTQLKFVLLKCFDIMNIVPEYW
jgi:hypothetical protein